MITFICELTGCIGFEEIQPKGLKLFPHIHTVQSFVWLKLKELVFYKIHPETLQIALQCRSQAVGEVSSSVISIKISLQKIVKFVVLLP